MPHMNFQPDSRSQSGCTTQPFHSFWPHCSQIFGKKDHEPPLSQSESVTFRRGFLVCLLFVLLSLDEECVSCSWGGTGCLKPLKQLTVKNEMECMTLGESSLGETIALCAPSGGFLPPLNSTALISSFTQSHPAGVFLSQSIVSCQMSLACSRPPFGC